MSEQYDAIEAASLQEAKVSYAWRRALDEQARMLNPPRPWWYWLALLAYLGFMAGGFWIVWRAFMGWPMHTGRWLERLAG